MPGPIRFSLRTIFIAITALAVVLGLALTAYQHWSLRRQEQVGIWAMEPYGGVFSMASALGYDRFRGQPEWLMVHFTNYVASVDLSPQNWSAKQRQGRTRPVDDKALVVLESFPNLRSLDLRDTRVTDAGLVHVKGLRQLESVELSNTRVTAEGVRGLQQALRNCRIHWEPLAADKRDEEGVRTKTARSVRNP